MKERIPSALYILAAIALVLVLAWAICAAIFVTIHFERLQRNNSQYSVKTMEELSVG